MPRINLSLPLPCRASSLIILCISSSDKRVMYACEGKSSWMKLMIDLSSWVTMVRIVWDMDTGSCLWEAERVRCNREGRWLAM